MTSLQLLNLQIFEFFFFDILCDWLLKNDTVFSNRNIVMTISFSIILAMYDSFSWRNIYEFLWWFFRRRTITISYLFENFSDRAYGVARDPFWLVYSFCQWYLKTLIEIFRNKINSRPLCTMYLNVPIENVHQSFWQVHISFWGITTWGASFKH